MRQRRPRNVPPPGGEFEHVADLPSRSAIAAALATIAEPADLTRLAKELGVRGSAPRAALERRVRAMTRDGQLIETRSGRFGLAEKMELIAGRVLAQRVGYAFVRPERGGDDIYLAPREAQRTLHGDKILVRVAGFDRRGRPFGHVIEVLERAHERIVGRYFRDRGFGFVVPDNRHLHQDLLIPADAAGDARDGQIVVAVIEQQPERHAQAVGRIVEILGEHMAPGMEIEIAIRSHDLPSEWPADTTRAAADVPQAPTAGDVAARRDLRALPLVTIDGADARFRRCRARRGVRQPVSPCVAIADVAHYVRPGGALDDERAAWDLGLLSGSRHSDVARDAVERHLFPGAGCRAPRPGLRNEHRRQRRSAACAILRGRHTLARAPHLYRCAGLA